ncbi:MAG: hypothetical protein WAR76_02540 [Xanthobacteraceae bacterium]
MIKTRGHYLIDGRANALAHILHMLEKGLLGIQRSLLNGRPCHMISDATRPQPLALWLHRSVCGRHYNADPLSKPQTIWHGSRRCFAELASHAMPFHLK